MGRAPTNGRMSSAASRHKVFATLAACFFVLLAVAGSASGAQAAKHAAGSRDRVAPSAPSHLQVTSATATSVSLSWTRSTDNVRVKGYYVSVNGKRAVTVSGTTYSATGPGCGQTVSVTIVAFDRAGNRSAAAGTIASTTACGDTQPPTSPTSWRQAATTQDSVVLTWDPSTDNVGVVGYGVYRGGLLFAATPEATVTLSGLLCGSTYQYAVDAVDAAGNRSTSSLVLVVTADCPQSPPVDTIPPSPPAGLAAGVSTQTTVSLTWLQSSDNIGVQGYGVYKNGTAVSTVNALGSTVAGLTCGTSYTLSVDGYDAAGNRSPQASVTASTSACADTQPPTLPANLTATSRTTTSIALSWSASSDNVGVIGYGLYQGGLYIGTTPTTTTIFSGLTCNTNYTLSIDAYDALGNRSAKSIVGVATTACPDTAPPSTPTGVGASNVTQTSLTMTWTASSDNVGVTAYDVFRNGTKTSTGTTTTSSQTGLACGTSYSFGVVARDGAGNTSTPASFIASTAPCSTPIPPSTNLFYVDPNGSDSANGSQSSPWKTIAKACASTPFGAGNTIIVNSGSYTESVTCNLPCKTNLRGAGGRTAQTSVKGTADPLISLQNCADAANVQTVSGIRLDGQNRTAGTRGMSVVNVRGLTITDIQSESFKGTASGGGALNLDRVWNADVGNSVFRNSGAIFADYATGTLGIGNATDSVFHDLTIYDATALGVKGASAGALLQNVEFYNLDCTTGSATVLSWPALAFEMWQVTAVNVTIRDSRFNATVSLTDYNNGSPLASGWRYKVHNNRWTILPAAEVGGYQYALELDQHSSEVHHNYFNGGVNPISNFTADVKQGNSIHHNVFDNQENWVALMRVKAGVQGYQFYKNTVVMRQDWWTALFKFDENGNTNSTINMYDNIFTSLYSVGDVLGPNLGSATVNNNVFYQLTRRGTNAVVPASQPLALSGGFPSAYIPAAASATASFGAFADGIWSVGPA